MPISTARAARLVNRAQFSFEEHVNDPRNPRGVRHKLPGMLALIVASFSCLKNTLRKVESLSEDIAPKILKKMGLKKTVSDTAIYEMLPGLNPDDFRPVLWDQVRRDIDSKAISNDLFRGGILTFDGKGAGSGMGESPSPFCRESVCDDKGTKYWDAFALRVCLSSSSARPVLDQQFILRKANEISTFPEMFERVKAQFPKLFRYVTWDAGLTCEGNARLVRDADKHYVGAIKANFSKMFPLAQKLLAVKSAEAFTEERAQGQLVRRELRRVSAPPGLNLPDLTEFWSVEQTSIDKGTSKIENRVFAVSIPPTELSGEQCLCLVRMHWGIENGPNWTADVFLDEDTRTQCTRGEAVLSLGWLKLLAYNLLSVFRAHLPFKDRRPESWERSADLVYQAFLMFDFLTRETNEQAVTLV